MKRQPSRPQRPATPSATSAASPRSVTKLRAGSAEDVLAYIPHQLGFAPRDSLVGLTMLGTTLRATARVDLPEDGPAALPWLNDYAANFVSMLLSDDEADSVLLAFYTEQAWTELPSPPQGLLLAALAAQLETASLRLAEAWHVGPQFWRNMTCTDPQCCPWPGRPVESITNSIVGTELVYLGSSFDRDVEAATVLALAPEDDAACRAFRARVDPVARELRLRIANSQQFKAVLEAWELAVSKAAGDDLLHFLAASLDFPTVRDAVLVQCTVGAALAYHGSVASGLFDGPVRSRKSRAGIVASGAAIVADDEDLDLVWPAGWPPTQNGEAQLQEAFIPKDSDGAEQFGAVLIGRSACKPDWKRVEHVEGLLTVLARLSQGSRRATAVTMLAWLQWVKGRGVRSGALLTLALDEDPDYRLALLLSQLLERGILCGWAKDRSRAWRRSAQA